MHFHQQVHTDFRGGMGQLPHLLLLQGGHDQQHRVGANRPGLDDLVGIHRKVLAQHRQLTGRAGLLQVGIRSLEEIHVGKHRQAGGAAALVAGGDLRRLEIRADHALAGRRLFHLGDDRCLPRDGARRYRRRKAAHGGLLGDTLFQAGQGIAGATLGHFLALAGQDLVQNSRYLGHVVRRPGRASSG